MKFGHCLPAEVWLNIFNHIESKQHLAQCKLVCKTWVPLIERTMLRCVQLNSRDTPKLYQYLVEKPEVSRYIQRLSLDYLYEVASIKLNTFLKVAMTPSLKAIDGDLESRGELTAFYNMARSARYKHVKLESVPTFYWFTKSYCSLLYHYRETLQSITLKIRDYTRLEYLNKTISDLNQFKSLTKLTIHDEDRYFTCIQKVDKILSGCNHLKRLELHLRSTSNLPQTNESELRAWLVKTVRKVESVKSIHVSYNQYIRQPHSGFHWDLMDFLSFKYPSAESVYISGHSQDEQCTVRLLFGNANTVHLDKWSFVNTHAIAQAYDTWKSQDNSISIRYESMSGFNEDVCTMGIIKDNKAAHTQFKITNIPQMTPLRNVKKLLPSCETMMSIKHLEINLVRRKYSSSGGGTVVDLLEGVPLVETVTLITCNEALGRGNVPHLTRLHTMDITRSFLREGDIPYLGSLVPNLRHLKLSSCFQYGDLGKRYKQYIHLPKNHLSTLTWQSENKKFIRYRHTVNALITLAINGNPQRIYLSRPNKPLLKLSREEFDTEFQSTDVFSIECASLKHLIIGMDNLALDLKFDQDGNVIESNPSIVEQDTVFATDNEEML